MSYLSVSPSRLFATRHLARALAVMLLLLLPACGGSGGGASISLVQVGQSATTLTLDVTANGVTDLYGIAFDLQYPAQLFDLIGSSEQPFLSQGGSTATTLQVNEATAGQIVVGFTRLGGVSGVSGSGALIRLQFQAKASGSGGFAFSRNQAFVPSGTLNGLSWLGGSVQVTL